MSFRPAAPKSASASRCLRIRAGGWVAALALSLAAPSSAGPAADVDPGAASPRWRALAAGLDEARVSIDPTDAAAGAITLIRIDPACFELVVAGPGFCEAAAPKSVRRWARELRLTAAINAGMYATDFRSHVGYLESNGVVNSQDVTAYKSVAAFDPRNPARPAFRIFDLDAPGVTPESIRQDYGSVVQNLRLIGRPGVNRWRPKPERWSEAALGEDEAGRILFIFCSEPLTMFELNRRLLSCGAGIVAAQHLEGGPQAQLFVRAGDFELDLNGGVGGAGWPVPLVLGARPRVVAPGRP